MENILKKTKLNQKLHTKLHGTYEINAKANCKWIHLRKTNSKQIYEILKQGFTKPPMSINAWNEKLMNPFLEKKTISSFTHIFI